MKNSWTELTFERLRFPVSAEVWQYVTYYRLPSCGSGAILWFFSAPCELSCLYIERSFWGRSTKERDRHFFLVSRGYVNIRSCCLSLQEKWVCPQDKCTEGVLVGRSQKDHPDILNVTKAGEDLVFWMLNYQLVLSLSKAAGSFQSGTTVTAFKINTQYLFTVAAVTNYRKFGSLKQYPFLILQSMNQSPSTAWLS